MIGEGRVLGRCPKVRTDRLAGHFENEKGFFQELMKNDFLRSYYLGFDWYGRIALIKSKIFITTGMSWPISSHKWKAPQLASRFASFPWHIARLDIPLYLSGAWDRVSHTVWSRKGYSLLRTQKKTVSFFKCNKLDLRVHSSFYAWAEVVPHRKWNFTLRVNGL